jgi:hypothetical protein
MSTKNYTTFTLNCPYNGFNNGGYDHGTFPLKFDGRRHFSETKENFFRPKATNTLSTNPNGSEAQRVYGRR